MDSDWTVHGNVYIQEESSLSACQNKYEYHNKMLIMQKSSYDYVKLSCDQVGGKLPIINKNSMIANVQKKTNELMKNFTTDIEYNNCITENGLVKLWLGQTKENSRGEWVNPYNANDDFNTFKIPRTPSKCVYVLGDKVFPAECSGPVACGLCNLGEDNTLPKTIIKMKGICGDDLWRKKYYDLDYYVYGVKNGKPHFRQVICYQNYCCFQYIFIEISQP